MPSASLQARRSRVPPRRQAGVYDRKLTIQVKLEVLAPGQFEPTVTWVTVAEPWAQRQVLSGSERYQQGEQFAARVDAIFLLAEHIDDLKHDMRILETQRDGRVKTYDITAILPPERDGDGQEVHVFEHAD